MSAATQEKAARLLREGRLDPDPGPARVFRVEGDSGTYTTVVGAHVQLCTCPAEARCSHIEAAVEWVLAEAALMEESAAGGDLSRRALQFSGYLEAVTVRKHEQREAAESVFARLAR